jgi:hypothetical protein
MHLWKLLCAALVTAVFALPSAPAGAVTLDWDVHTWSPGALSQSFDIDPERTGNDITLAITGNTNVLAVDPASGVQTPAVNQSLHGGLTPPQNSLFFHLVSERPTDSITITITFSAEYTEGVTNVSFTLFDIDKSNYRDKVSDISATSIDGTTMFAPSITVGSAVNTSGGGFNQTITGNSADPDTGVGSGAGNATISFSGYGIRSVTFKFENATAFPSPQEFALGDITFTPVPELNPVISAFGSCLLAAGLVFHHRGRVRARRK